MRCSARTLKSASRAATILILAMSSATSFGQAAKSVSQDSKHSSPVGMTHAIEQLVLPGPEVRVKPISQQTPVVVRIIEVFLHGSNSRYDIEYYGLDPGTYNLIDFFEREDGSSLDNVEEIPIEITPELPAGQIEPSKLTQNEITGMGGYNTTTIVFGVCWVIGLLAILLIGRRKREDDSQTTAKPVSLADRLRPLVDDAIRGELSHAQLAELELTLIAFWRKQLDLDGEQAAAVISKLRTHKEAGPLLVQLENWLHNPNPATDIDVGQLLQPYQSLPPDALELESRL